MPQLAARAVVTRECRARQRVCVEYRADVLDDRRRHVGYERHVPKPLQKLQLRKDENTRRCLTEQAANEADFNRVEPWINILGLPALRQRAAEQLAEQHEVAFVVVLEHRFRLGRCSLQPGH